ncbi:MAG: hypothetical protein NC081_09565 [Roseburia sp.]|nr:hypothetical protein [Roseburia sp.]
MRTMKALSRPLGKVLALVCALALAIPADVQAAVNSGAKTDISKAVITVADQTYNGSAQTAAVTVKVDKNTLKEGTDYTVSGNKNTNAGTYTLEVKGMGNYTGTAKKQYQIKAKSVSGLSATAKTVTYNGKNQTAGIEVKDGSRTLKKGTDYTVSGTTKAKEAGKYTITVNGKGNYSGTKKITFTIKAKSVSGLSATAKAVTYSGKNQTAGIVVKDGSKTLKKGTDYTVSGTTKAKKAGKYTITIKGKGNYSGTKKITFTIKKASQKITVKGTTSVKASTVKKASKKYQLKVSGVKEKAKVSYKSDSKKITVDKNGKVTVKKGTKKGTKATITITVASTGNYKKTTKKVTFQVK